MKDLSQNNILQRIGDYLSIESKRGVKRDPEFIKEFGDGYCSGISSLWLYSKYLDTQPIDSKIAVKLITKWAGKSKLKRKEAQRLKDVISIYYKSRTLSRDGTSWLVTARDLIAAWAGKKSLKAKEKKDLNKIILKYPEPRDDHEWFSFVVKALAYWRPQKTGKEKRKQKKLTKKEKSEIERFISYIQFFQHINYYLPISQGDLDIGLAGGVAGKKSNKKKLRKEYSIGSLFTLKQLKLLFKEEGIIRDGRLIYISSHNHAVALFREGSVYYYFDSNNKKGEVKKSSLDDIAKLIFESNDFSLNKPSPLAFKMFSFDKKTIPPYPSQQKVLAKIKPDLGFRKRYADGYSGLIMAVKSGCFNCVKYFLENGVDPNVQTGKSGKTAIMMAMRCKDINIFKELFNHQKTDFAIKDKHGDNLLMIAINFVRFDVINEILDSGRVDESFLNDRNGIGETPVMMAMGCNDINIFKKIFNHQKTDFAIKDKYGNNLLMTAINLGKFDFINEILGSDRVDESFLNDRNDIGENALILAVRSKYAGVVRNILQKGADPDAREKGESCLPALLTAVLYGDIATVKVLLEYNANPNINEKESASTPLMYAAMLGQIEIVEEILSHKKVDPNIKNKDGYTVLMQLIQAEADIDFDVFKKILYHEKTDPNIQDEDGDTILMLLVQREIEQKNKVNIKLINLLLSHGKINLGIKDQEGDTVFQQAEAGELPVVLSLLKKKAESVGMVQELSRQHSSLFGKTSRVAKKDEKIVNKL